MNPGKKIRFALLLLSLSAFGIVASGADLVPSDTVEPLGLSFNGID